MLSSRSKGSCEHGMCLVSLKTCFGVAVSHFRRVTRGYQYSTAISLTPHFACPEWSCVYFLLPADNYSPAHWLSRNVAQFLANFWDIRGPEGTSSGRGIKTGSTPTDGGRVLIFRSSHSIAPLITHTLSCYAFPTSGYTPAQPVQAPL